MYVHARVWPQNTIRKSRAITSFPAEAYKTSSFPEKQIIIIRVLKKIRKKKKNVNDVDERNKLILQQKSDTMMNNIGPTSPKRLVECLSKPSNIDSSKQHEKKRNCEHKANLPDIKQMEETDPLSTPILKTTSLHRKSNKQTQPS